MFSDLSGPLWPRPPCQWISSNGGRCLLYLRARAPRGLGFPALSAVVLLYLEGFWDGPFLPLYLTFCYSGVPRLASQWACACPSVHSALARPVSVLVEQGRLEKVRPSPYRKSSSDSTVLSTESSHKIVVGSVCLGESRKDRMMELLRSRGACWDRKVLGAKPNTATFADFSGKSPPFCVLNLACSSSIELTCKPGGAWGQLCPALSWVGDSSTVENRGEGLGVWPPSLPLCRQGSRVFPPLQRAPGLGESWQTAALWLQEA